MKKVALTRRKITKTNSQKINFDGWNFAIVNKRLAEIYFEKRGEKRIPWAHCYVNRGEYKTARERRQIAQDIQHLDFSYRDKKYTQKKPL